MAKKENIFFTVGLIFLVAIYLFLRLYKFEEKTIYWMDQGFQLSESYQMVKNKKIPLIGPMVSLKTSTDKSFFIGPQYYYVLGILGIITSWNPISIDIILLLLEFGFILYFIFWIKKKYGQIEALSIFGLITFSQYLIINSRFFWNPHFLFSFGILAYISLDNYIETLKNKYLLYLGILWGLAFGFHYAGILWGLPILVILLNKKQFFKKQIFTVLPIGFILGDFPWFAFELRNNFYNIKTILSVIGQNLNNGNIEPHYIVYPLIVFVLVGISLVLNKIKNKKNKILIGLILIIGISWIQKPLNQPNEWNYVLQKQIINIMLKNGCPKYFNVVSTIQGDTRAYDLRYLLNLKKCEPMGVEDYPNAEKLFLIAPIDRPPETETVWEVSSLGEFKISKQEKLTEKIVFWELIKN